MKLIHHMRFGALLAVLALAGTTHASEQTFTQNYFAELTTSQAGVPVIQDLTVQGFNTNRGTLLGVNIRMDVGVVGQWGVENLSARGRYVEVGGIAHAALYGRGGAEVMDCLAGVREKVELQPFDGTCDCRGASAAHDDFYGSESVRRFFAPDRFWTKAANPQGLPLRFILVGRVGLDQSLYGVIQARTKFSVSITYRYDDNSIPDLLNAGRDAAGAPAPLDAWREEPDSLLA